jgi:DNA-binding beta-propeller fold protein YncE
VVGTAVSPNGRWLYATSEQGVGVPRPSSPSFTAGGYGTLSVIDVARAERSPASSVVATVVAGCSPVRVAVSPDGRDVWVTARGSDSLLAYSASRLVTDPSHALLAAVRVGEAPVGVALAADGREVVVADSNRFSVPGETANLAVIDTAAALDGRSGVVAVVRTGLFPRDLAVSPDGHTLLVTNYVSGQLEAVDLADVP